MTHRVSIPADGTALLVDGFDIGALLEKYPNATLVADWNTQETNKRPLYRLSMGLLLLALAESDLPCGLMYEYIDPFHRYLLSLFSWNDDFFTVDPGSWLSDYREGQHVIY